MKNSLYALIMTALLIPVSVGAMERVIPQEEVVEKNTLIFDLGGLYFATGKGAFVGNAASGWKILGALKVTGHMVTTLSNPMTYVQKRLFETLRRFPMVPEAGFKYACTEHGEPMPYALCAYQAGRVTSEQMRALVNKVCDELWAEGFFGWNLIEQNLMRSLMKAMFTPSMQAEANYALDGGIELLKQVAALKNADGTKKYRMIALSNWDRESFEFVRSNYKDVRECFDSVVLSGEIGTVKPNEAAYEAVFKRHPELKKENCRFIDDQKENIDAATAYGIESALVKRKDAASLAKILQDWNILPAAL